MEIDQFISYVAQRDANEPEFLQAVSDVTESVLPFIRDNPRYQKEKILERIVEPERVVIFRVPWVNDRGEIEVNRGFRVQMNSAIGPYKGGLRFHPSVNLSILKFLAFEQTFKNSLTGLPMGSGKGGSDFNTRNRSDGEVMRFCQSFMTELFRHIGSNLDVPAGDIGVGAREIGYLFGQYKRIKGSFTGVLTGKGSEFGGSLIRPEATGYGLVYFTEEILQNKGDSMQGKKVTISGSGNVAQYALQKSIELGATVVSMSDSDGTIYDEAGIDDEKLAYIMKLKNNHQRIHEYASKYKCEYLENEKPWKIPCDIALPCATQNELNQEDARQLIDNGAICIAEGANMPCTSKAIHLIEESNILYGPGKAANAGGVTVSGLEMSQNSLRFSWSREKVDHKLRNVMHQIHKKCLHYGRTEDGHISYEKGANIAGFVKVAEAMIALGVV
ncbi:NADP-specific glutamate dehydrogenase [Membranicola marinus]|uniref:Glutamate dehydrogenase n=1 Tax=Membranihabitans marinus TaxID=1227546 RepID=A0A953HTZ9_9BACT|nr:NADP-specific glutamate dehydrogenase [Membranihabitans marinus]MBY5958400.1 NADP-specific glutamate dehydrogenase [Membranihabitans marinus]